MRDMVAQHNASAHSESFILLILLAHPSVADYVKSEAMGSIRVPPTYLMLNPVVVEFKSKSKSKFSCKFEG